MIDLWPLLGVLLITIGMALRLNTLLVILVAGVVTGLIASLPIMDILSMLGKSFTKNRYMSLFILILPVVGILERYGLKQVAEDMMRKIKGATSGKVSMIYMVARNISVAFGIHIGGHPTMIRPVVSPMAEAAAEKDREPLDENEKDRVRALSAASENFGNFFGQLMFIASSGLLLIKGVFDDKGYKMELNDMFVWAIPTAIAAIVVFFVYMKIEDRKIKKGYYKIKEEKR